jgi:1,4-alpha-glucan branching enzyme
MPLALAFASRYTTHIISNHQYGRIMRSFSELDVYLFKQGRHTRLYEFLGGHLAEGGSGAHFAVWAPNATAVFAVGDFNHWHGEAHPLSLRPDGTGIWEGWVPEARQGHRYKYRVCWPGGEGLRADPCAVHAETPPATASILWPLAGHAWEDGEWMASRRRANGLDAPMAIYEVHLGSWRRGPGGRWLSYREMAHELADYVASMGFTHVELLPVAEHPFYGSWGYQATGYFAPTSRYGTPQDFMYLVDYLHRRGIGVILDWVPGHFPTDAHGLARFDGTALYEHADPRQGFHPDWKSAIFNYGRYEVAGFLLSNALYWLREYHIDGLRVDGVASMLYLDYSRRPGEWVPNRYGGRENLEAIQFLRTLNTLIYGEFPDVQTIAEESTAWPMVSRPVYLGGLGFGLKWNMGWMHDTLRYMSLDPIFRKYHHNQLTFAIWYAFTENFVLPLSHDEVVHGKGSLVGKLPGDIWQKMAGLRLLLAYMYALPGKKLLFMGAEIAQWKEWNHDEQLDWALLDFPFHSGVQHFVRDMNRLYRDLPALHQVDFDSSGFQWENCFDSEQSVVSFFRRDKEGREVLVVLNATPVPRHGYVVGVPRPGVWRELLNSDAAWYGGSNLGNAGAVTAWTGPVREFPYGVHLTLPPLAAVFLCHEDCCPPHWGSM